MEDGTFKFEYTLDNDIVIEVDCPHYYPSRPPECPSDPFSEHRVKVYLPMTAEAGDWCLFIERTRHGRNLPQLFGLEWLVLVVRSNDDLPKSEPCERFSIVGRGYAIQVTVFGSAALSTDALLRGQDAFEVFCTAEDALVLAGSFIEGVPTAWHEALLQRHLLTTVCGWPGSSFAIRSEDDPRSSEEKSEFEHLAWMTR